MDSRFLVVAALVMLPSGARADSAHPDAYELQIYKLGNPGTDASAHGRFRAFARQLGAAITSVNLSPPDTLGHSAFAVTAELSVVIFNEKTPADSLPTFEQFKGPLLVPSIHFRKGLPASFELGGRAAWIEKSRMGVGTLELKWAINEGFTYLPDIAVRGSVSKIINSRDFDLTTGGFDIAIGKQFALAGMVTITPYAGWNLLFVGATSNSVDFNPKRTLAESDDKGGQYTDFSVFNAVNAAENAHNRFYAGFRFIGGVFQLGAEVSYSVVSPAVLAWNFHLGLDF